jgi:hypothetical protein
MQYMKECQDAGVKHSSNKTNHSTTAPKGNAHHTIHKKRARSTKSPSEDDTRAHLNTDLNKLDDDNVPDEHFYIPEDGGMSMSGVLSRGSDIEEAVFVGKQKNGWTTASDDKKFKWIPTGTISPQTL